MAKTWPEFVQIQTAQTSTWDDTPPVGMSDEEELRRVGEALAETFGVGEVSDSLVELEDDYSLLGLQDLADRDSRR